MYSTLSESNNSNQPELGQNCKTAEPRSTCKSSEEIKLSNSEDPYILEKESKAVYLSDMRKQHFLTYALTHS